MSLLRRLILAVVSRERAASMEAESRRWMLQCSECGQERSVWDLGGLRYGASGNPSYAARCLQCGKRTTHRVELRPDGGT